MRMRMTRDDQDKGTFTNYRHDPDNPNSLSNDRIMSIYEDSDQVGEVLWIGTFGGLNRFDRAKGIFTHYKHDPDDPNSLSHNNINVIYEDRLGVLWIGTRVGGLNKFDREKSIFTHYTQTGDPNSLSHNEIHVIYESPDKPGVLWIGTQGGLNRFDQAKETFIHYGMKEGLPNDVIAGILEDNDNHLWLSTFKGISKFDPQIETFKNYDVHDGLQSNEFNMGACYKGKSGKMFFGGINGFNAFYPENIKDNTYEPRIVITDFQIFNESVKINNRQSGWHPNIGRRHAYTLENHITETTEIVLSHKESFFSFEFAALHYSLPDKKKYAYKMEGFDEDWINVGIRRFATYTNLDAGEYIFKVKGSNNDGVWNQAGTSIKIIINPPWWRTLWAYGLYALLFVGSIFGYIRYKTSVQAIELAQERRVSNRLRRVDKLKDEFLANTSHELRTPLHGIIGLSESLYDNIEKEPSEKQREDLSMIISSGKRLSSLVDDILDFSKLKNYDIELMRKPIGFRALVDIVLKNNAPLAKGKNLQFINDIPTDLPAVDGDENRLQQVLYNLIGNSIKFTESGFLKLSAFEKDGMVQVSVEDTGIGIPENKRDAIFQEFEQGDGSISREFAGTGLGLSISKWLVELHGGEMWVDSKVGKGSTFFFTLPISKEKAVAVTPAATVSRIALESSPVKKIEVTKAVIINGLSDQIHILVVDDEPINQQVFKNHLSNEHYELTQAMNGEEAINALKKGQHFDLVLLDIMMPSMSGYEVCRKIREKNLPSELPVIIVTAKNQVQDLVHGLALGANDYLAKPFTKQEFLARVKTQLDLHRINAVTSKFVPNEFLRLLGKDRITEVALGDNTEREVTVLFSDIRDYTTLSESMTPEENFKFVNAYNGHIGPGIRQHHGFINQYLGDSIMAIFPECSGDCLKAAVEMQKTLLRYNQIRESKNRTPIRTGIGLHTGRLIMGIIGDQKRMDAATISDTVNTASRIESLTKFYGVSILLSEDSYVKIDKKENFRFRYMGQVQVKGKQEPVGIYECFDGDMPELAEKKYASLELFQEGLNHYFSKDFPRASVVFQEILKTNPDDSVAKLFLNKAAQYIGSGVADDWSGVEMMTFK